MNLLIKKEIEKLKKELNLAISPNANNRGMIQASGKNIKGNIAGLEKKIAALEAKLGSELKIQTKKKSAKG